MGDLDGGGNFDDHDDSDGDVPTTVHGNDLVCRPESSALASESASATECSLSPLRWSRQRASDKVLLAKHGELVASLDLAVDFDRDEGCDSDVYEDVAVAEELQDKLSDSGTLAESSACSVTGEAASDHWAMYIASDCPASTEASTSDRSWQHHSPLTEAAQVDSKVDKTTMEKDSEDDDIDDSVSNATAGTDDPVYTGPPLVAGWTSHWDDEYSRFYFFNSGSGESTWVPPLDHANACKPAVPPPGQSVEKIGLTETTDAETADIVAENLRLQAQKAEVERLLAAAAERTAAGRAALQS
eukprot:SAG31_NODE_5106_length_2740_cov_6.966538_3_plen_300_part_00